MNWWGHGVCRAEKLIKHASAHRISGVFQRGLAKPATDQLAGQLRPGLHDLRKTNGGKPGEDAASGRPPVELKGLTRGGLVARLERGAAPDAGLVDLQPGGSYGGPVGINE